ncbi:MAG TPA: Fur family transcriptional regulator [Virgibacillus sp.]|nr:Fur family transcriptional regulator [Virgibacillus sp.]
MNVHEAVQLLKKHGYKVTKRRKDMITFFEQSDGYRTAKNVIEYMKGHHQGISFDTVYRNLHLFNELGILETTELQAEKHFRMNCTDHHHHHFICNDCGKTKKIHMCPMDDVEDSLANYYIKGHKFEVYGLCPVCQSA